MIRVKGHPVPATVTDYFSALDGGRLEQAAACFSADVLYAVAAAAGDEVGPRRECRGTQSVLGCFAQRGGRKSEHRILVCAGDGPSCLIEGVVRDLAGTGEPCTFAASLQFEGDGRIARYLAYLSADAIIPGSADHRQVAGFQGARVLEEYFASLESGAFEEAAGCFSEDVLYSHPPYRHTGITDDHRINFGGRPALLEGFRRRGKQSFNHRILVLGQAGPNCLVEGVVEGLPDGRTGSFVSSFSLAGDGRIHRYVSFYCEPAVSRV
jgi:ketosteroid isomerase-like protein